MSSPFVRMFATLALCMGWGISVAEQLVVFGDDAYRPVVYLQDGKPQGELTLILRRASEITGDTYELQLMPWKRAYELAARGEGGVIGVSLTQERARTFDYSQAMYDDDIQIVTLKGKTFNFSTLDDLKGKVIGGVNGASYGEAVDQAIAERKFAVERDVSQSGRLRKLLAGRLDAAFIGNGQAGFEAVLASDPELASRRKDFVILPRPLARDPLHLAFAKSMNRQEALARFDAALVKLRKAGVVRAGAGK